LSLRVVRLMRNSLLSSSQTWRERTSMSYLLRERSILRIAQVEEEEEAEEQLPHQQVLYLLYVILFYSIPFQYALRNFKRMYGYHASKEHEESPTKLLKSEKISIVLMTTFISNNLVSHIVFSRVLFILLHNYLYYTISNSRICSW
jgi:hypothetical protein